MPERSKIKGIVKEDTKEMEQFQNEVLRPILKLQHNLIIESFQVYLKQRKIDFPRISSQDKTKHIESILSKDIAYKNQQIGMIVGRFTLQEYQIYKIHYGEYNRRILQMLKKRLKDTFIQ